MRFSVGYPLLRHPADPAFTTPEFLGEAAAAAAAQAAIDASADLAIARAAWLAATAHAP